MINFVPTIASRDEDATMVGLWKAWKVIPACVVLAMRKQFSEADGNTGRKINFFSW